MSQETYARAGSVATETVTLDAGPLLGPAGLPLAHSLEPSVRGLGLPTRLNKGVVELLAEHTVCRQGRRLTASQCQLLRMFDYKLARSALTLDCVWEADAFEQIAPEGEGDEGEEGGLEGPLAGMGPGWGYADDEEEGAEAGEGLGRAAK